ncbi:tetraspanin [Plakobranchus ocellatus]|uniref:Tetraspanin n=1 Tax=Plakobranchus ocellatus TaxID=259542 RepID=A0AAV3ZHR5_9GAST|nr:tetraspanin [Plakobranchus ocellatus]
MQHKNRRDDAGCCSRIFLKSIMVVFNTFFWISGAAFLFLGLASLFLRHQYVPLLETPLFALTTYLFIGTGGLITILGAVGCVGTLQEIRGCLIFYAFMLMAVFMMETCVGVLAYMYEGAVHEELARNLNVTINNNYHFDREVTKAVDHMQTSFKCCGTSGIGDWQYSRWVQHNIKQNHSDLVPSSCCISPNTSCVQGLLDLHPSNVHTDGCLEHLESFVRLHLIIVGGVGLGLSILQLFGIIFSCCLAAKVKDDVSI